MRTTDMMVQAPAITMLLPHVLADVQKCAANTNDPLATWYLGHYLYYQNGTKETQDEGNRLLRVAALNMKSPIASVQYALRMMKHATNQQQQTAVKSFLLGKLDCVLEDPMVGLKAASDRGWPLAQLRYANEVFRLGRSDDVVHLRKHHATLQRIITNSITERKYVLWFGCIPNDAIQWHQNIKRWIDDIYKFAIKQASHDSLVVSQNIKSLSDLQVDLAACKAHITSKVSPPRANLGKFVQSSLSSSQTSSPAVSRPLPMLPMLTSLTSMVVPLESSHVPTIPILPVSVPQPSGWANFTTNPMLSSSSCTSTTSTRLSPMSPFASSNLNIVKEEEEEKQRLLMMKKREQDQTDSMRRDVIEMLRLCDIVTKYHGNGAAIQDDVDDVSISNAILPVNTIANTNRKRKASVEVQSVESLESLELDEDQVKQISDDELSSLVMKTGRQAAHLANELKRRRHTTQA
jgi:hypothetical protein